jgi:cell division protein ZapE
MDSFYSCVPVVRKTRLHFHEFMREVHRELEELRGRPTRWTNWPSASRRFRLICFDEFHVATWPTR